MFSRATVVLSAGLSLVLTVPTAAYAGVSAVPDDTPRVNGIVYAIAQVGTRTIIGGAFTKVSGKARDHVAAIRADGKLDPDFKPDVNGIVYSLAAAADDATVFIGGLFSRAGGADRANLAAVDAVTGAARPEWTADTTGETPEVLALAVSGTQLFAGGQFSGIDGTNRRRVAALSVGYGDVIRTFDPLPDLGTVRFLAPNPDGTTIFAGGGFETIGGQSRPAGVAELFADTGLATPFNPQAVGSGVVAMGISPRADRIYFGVRDNRVFAYDVASSVLLWTTKNSGNTQAIAVTDTEIYLGGHFSQNNDTRIKRLWIMSLHVDGTITGWDPQLSGSNWSVWAIVATPTALQVGGGFTKVGDLARPHFARFSGTP